MVRKACQLRTPKAKLQRSELRFPSTSTAAREESQTRDASRGKGKGKTKNLFPHTLQLEKKGYVWLLQALKNLDSEPLFRNGLKPRCWRSQAQRELRVTLYSQVLRVAWRSQNRPTDLNQVSPSGILTCRKALLADCAGFSPPFKSRAAPWSFGLLR